MLDHIQQFIRPIFEHAEALTCNARHELAQMDRHPLIGFRTGFFRGRNSACPALKVRTPKCKGRPLASSVWERSEDMSEYSKWVAERVVC